MKIMALSGLSGLMTERELLKIQADTVNAWNSMQPYSGLVSDAEVAKLQALWSEIDGYLKVLTSQMPTHRDVAMEDKLRQAHNELLALINNLKMTYGSAMLLPEPTERAIRYEEEPIEPALTEAERKPLAKAESIWDRMLITAGLMDPSQIPELPGPEDVRMPEFQIAAEENLREPVVLPELSSGPALTPGVVSIKATDVTDRVIQEWRESADPAEEMTLPKPGTQAQPWLDWDGLSKVVEAGFAGYTAYQKMQIQTQLMEEQQKGKKIYTPPAVTQTIQKQTNWVPWAIGGVAVLALLGAGAIALRSTRS